MNGTQGGRTVIRRAGTLVRDRVGCYEGDEGE